MTDIEKGMLVFAFNLGVKNLILDHTCVGAEIDFVVAGSSVAIFLPSFIFVGTPDRPWLRPSFSETGVVGKWMDVQREDVSPYGYVSSYPGESTNETPNSFEVQRIVIGSRGELDRITADRILSETKSILLEFVKWVEVLAFWDSGYERLIPGLGRVLSPIFVDGSGQATQLDEPRHILQITMDKREPPNLDLLRRALWHAQTGSEIESIHSFLISAFRQAHRGNFRNAILDVATSMEMALIRISEASLKSNREAISSTYFRMFTGLVDLCDGIKILTGSAPLNKEELKNKIAQPRNAAIHRGEEITSREAFTAITFAREFIYSHVSLGNSTEDTR